MTTRNLIITTCGTSLLTNRAQDQITPPQCLNKYTNTRLAENIESIDDREQIAAHILNRQQTLRDASVVHAKNLSAELNGILSFYTESGRSPEKLPNADQHILLHTDTWLGTEVAAGLKAFLQARGANVTSQRINNLNTASLESFRHGIGSLIDWAASTIPGYRDAKYRIIFNLVGGFKSVQGFMQTIGMFYADDILYIFEGSQLIHIPRLPVNLDTAARQAVSDNISSLRRIAKVGGASRNVLGLHALPETFLFRLGDEVELSPWGKLIYEQAKPRLYQEKLLDSWSARLCFTDPFRKDADGLPPDKMQQLNERIDDLIRHLEVGNSNLRRLALKPLQGNPMPPATHECNAWADADCRRIFLHFDSDNRAVLHRVTQALH